MANAHVAKLRGDAKHCRRLASNFDDQPLIDALNLTADQFDAEADRIEEDEPLPGD